MKHEFQYGDVKVRVICATDIRADVIQPLIEKDLEANGLPKGGHKVIESMQAEYQIVTAADEKAEADHAKQTEADEKAAAKAEAKAEKAAEKDADKAAKDEEDEAAADAKARAKAEADAKAEEKAAAAKPHGRAGRH